MVDKLKPGSLWKYTGDPSLNGLVLSCLKPKFADFSLKQAMEQEFWAAAYEDSPYGLAHAFMPGDIVMVIDSNATDNNPFSPLYVRVIFGDRTGDVTWISYRTWVECFKRIA